MVTYPLNQHVELARFKLGRGLTNYAVQDGLKVMEGSCMITVGKRRPYVMYRA